MENRCVCCGEIIPEGRQICFICEVQNKTSYKKGYNACLDEILSHIDTYQFTPQGVDEILTDICKKLHSMKKEKLI